MSRIPKVLTQTQSNFRNSSRYETDIPKRVVIDPSRTELSLKYCVTDIPSAIIPATRLRKILENIELGCQLSAHDLIYLQQQRLISLKQLAQAEIAYEEFRKIAAGELFIREHEAAAKKLNDEKEAKVQEAIREAQYEIKRQRAEEARRKLERDPKYIAKIKNQQLRIRYGLDQYIEKESFSRLMSILHRLESGNRLNDEDILWLTTEGEDYYTEILQAAFHELEAEFYNSEYKRTSDPWNAVNASSHYRKCNQAGKAHDLLMSIPDTRQKSSKLNSAICTTHGGVMRDLERFEDALTFGNQAYALTPKDFRPCTLLGAVNFEIGNYDIGRNWYVKAEERGASKGSVDYDLRGIFLRADKTKREEIRTFLLREDPDRYKWVRNLKV